MRILFIDETDKQKNKNNRYFFVLCGLVTKGESLINLTNELNQIKESYKLDTLKDTRKTNLKKSIKIEITNKIYNSLKNNGAEIRSAFIGNISLRSIKTVNDVYFGALTFLIERYFLTLKDKNDTGIVIFDSVDKKLEGKLRKKFFDHILNEKLVWAVSGRVEGYYKERIFPSIFFSNDEHSTVLQVTDLIATSLNSAIWADLKKDILDVENLANKNDYLKIYWPLFVKSPVGKVNGWGIKIWQ
jgi:hypothetical protein